MTEESASLLLPLPLPMIGTWDGALLEPVAEINERMLESLQSRALALRASGERCGAPLLRGLAEEWCMLEVNARQRMAGCPYLLLDAGFPGPIPRPGRPAAGVHDTARAAGYFPGPEGVALVRRALMFAWHVARSNRLAARILLGMSPAAVERIGGCRLLELDALAEYGQAWAVPRWESQPAIWRQLLRAARDAAASQLRTVQLRGLQLLALQAG